MWKNKTNVSLLAPLRWMALILFLGLLFIQGLATEDGLTASQLQVSEVEKETVVKNGEDPTAKSSAHLLETSEVSVVIETHTSHSLQTTTSAGDQFSSTQDDSLLTTSLVPSLTDTATSSSSFNSASSISSDPVQSVPSSTQSGEPVQSQNEATEQQGQTDTQNGAGDIKQQEHQEQQQKQQHLQENPEPSELPLEDNVKVTEVTDAQENNQSTLPQQPDATHETDTAAKTIQVSLYDTAGQGGRTMDAPLDKEVKTEEEELTFNEWTQKVLAEAEKDKQEAKQGEVVSQVIPTSTKQRKKKNYGLHECGAKVLTSNPEATNAKCILNSNKDEYMINPCKAKKWFVIELCEPIQPHSVEIASLELFSSLPKFFRVYLSDRYPTKDWKPVGEFNTTQERTVQSFLIKDMHGYFAKFVRVELVDHYGDEHFCPVTFFRVHGIAVTDYEDDEIHPVETDDEDDDPDEVTDDDLKDTKNLFTSAKDTVLNIVKKVLNVEEEVQNNNATQQNVTDHKEGTLANETVDSQSCETQPCPPNAVIEGGEVMPPVEHTTSSPQPATPSPGGTDSAGMIVTKLEDDEQVETAVPSVGIKLPDGQIPVSSGYHSNHCYRMQVPKKKCLSKSSLNRFYAEFVKCPAYSFPLDKKHKTVKNGSAKVETVKSEVHATTSKVIVTETSSKIVSAQTKKSESVLISDSVSSKSKESGEKSSSTVLTESSVSSQSVTESVVSDSSSQVSATPLTDIKVTSTVEELSQTVPPVQSQASGVSGQTGIPSVSESQSSGSVKIDPSPVGVPVVTETTPELEPTPSLPVTWKPNTEGLMDTEAQHSTVISQSEVVTDTVIMEDATIAVQAPDDRAPADGTATQEVKGQADVADLIQDATLEDKQIEEETKQVNLSITDDKMGMRVPGLPPGKRESAIMRLSNRIKVLEQNVSLSSRFLEELSRRYKKQSEDMMKLLNRTVSRLTNMTVETEVTTKIHEDEMSMMEKRLENLTAIVTHLTSNLEHLNKQVTDRQMIWTSIQIILIFIVLFFMKWRRTQDTVTPEIRTLIESMPSQPPRSVSKRRNSISGPATPSKKKTSDLSSGITNDTGLTRFNSETRLASSEFPIMPAADSGTRHKKKKKKTKNGDYKVFPQVSGPNSSQYVPPDKGPRPGSSSGLQSSPAGLLFPGPSDTDRGGGWGSWFGVGFRRGSSSKTPNPHSTSSNQTSDFDKIPKVADRQFQIKSEPSNASQGLIKDDKVVTKGHKRQKSLPKQHYTYVETLGSNGKADSSSSSVDGQSDSCTGSHSKRGQLRKSRSLSSASSSKSNDPSPVTKSSSSSSTASVGFEGAKGGKNKKLPQCGVQALYYGVEDVSSKHQSYQGVNMHKGKDQRSHHPVLVNGLHNCKKKNNVDSKNNRDVHQSNSCSNGFHSNTAIPKEDVLGDEMHTFEWDSYCLNFNGQESDQLKFNGDNLDSMHISYEETSRSLIDHDLPRPKETGKSRIKSWFSR